jgi:rare lipoprotein A
VRINDRGPFKRGRIIDLSHAAARKIDMLGPGTAKVRLTVIPMPSATPTRTAMPARWGVQVGSFRDRRLASELAARMEREGRHALETAAGEFTRVMVCGLNESESEARALLPSLSVEFPAAVVTFSTGNPPL